MPARQYIGARYVTKVYENSLNPGSAEWEAGINYEPLTMVTYNMGSYLSKKEVPASVGDPASNTQYWVQTGFYNGQIAYLDSIKQNKELDTPVTISGSVESTVESALGAIATELPDKVNNGDIAIIINGDKTEYAYGATIGEYVLIINSTISGVTDGMYKAIKVIPYNTTIDSTYVAACSSGGLNDLFTFAKAKNVPSAPTTQSNYTLSVYIMKKCGDIVIGYININVVTPSSSFVQIDQLPTGYRPDNHINFAAFSNDMSVNDRMGLQIRTSGNFQVLGGTAGNTYSAMFVYTTL